MSYGLSNLKVVVDEWAGFGKEVLISMFQGTLHFISFVSNFNSTILN